MPSTFVLPGSVHTLLVALLVAAPTAVGAAESPQLAADRAVLEACVAAAFPEGDLLRGAPVQVVAPGDCIGRLERTPGVCDPSEECARRETSAWLAIAADLAREKRPAANRAAIRAGVSGVLERARVICTAAAAASAWGGDRVAAGTYRVEPDSPCLRDAVAGMVMPLMGHLRGN